MSPKERLNPEKRWTLNRLEIYVTIVGTILGMLFTWSQLRIAQSEEERAQRTEPLTYTLQTVNTHYEYEIEQDGEKQTLPAPSLRLKVIHGSLHAVTAISYDGTTVYDMETPSIQDNWSGMMVDITLPPRVITQEKGILYDYFFLYLEPVEGAARLDLIYNAVSPETKETNGYVVHQIDMLRLKGGAQGAQREMLEVYAQLTEQLEELGCLPCRT